MTDDDHRRRGDTARLADILRDHDIPVPELLPDMVATPGHAGDAAVARERRVARRAAMLGLGWPELAVDDALAADERMPAIRIVDRWHARDSQVLVLSGPVGVGKTVAAAWYSLGPVVVLSFVRAAELARVGRFSPKWDEWLHARALCVDDLGVEYADDKGSFASDVDHLLDVFYGNRRRLIITTNCDVKAFRERYGQRIMDRISQRGDWQVVTGRSLRRT